MARGTRSSRRRLLFAVVVGCACAATAATYAAVQGTNTNPASPSVTPPTAQTAVAGTGSIAAGQQVVAQTYSKPPSPTPAQAAYLKEFDQQNVPAPNRVTANPTTNPGPAVPEASVKAADADYKRFAVRTPPVASFSGGSGYSSFTNEPSVAQSGQRVFLTGNWYAGKSTAYGGGSWTFLDPFSLFGNGFCCDQVALYDKAHDRVYWVLQFSDHLVVANSPSSDLTSWCYYNFYAGTIGQASTTELDFNDGMIGTRDLYLTTNVFPTSGFGSEVVRIPLEQMATCGGIGFNYYSQLDSFTWRLVQGSNDRAYWGSDWDPTGSRPNGSSFRLFWWDESSGTLFWNNYTIDPFAFYVRNSGQNCASQDGVVKNWCQYADSRTLGAYRANGVIGFSMNANQGGFAPFPYTVREYFRESDLAYLGHTNLWATNVGIQFLSLAPNSQGHVGGTYYWGGGTGTTHNYPGTAALVEDDVTPSQPWTNDFFYPGRTNTCTYGGLYRWGDYSTTRANNAADTTWIGAGYKHVGDCSTGYAQPVIVLFGRSRDSGNFARWR